MHECLNSGVQPLPGDECGFDGESKSLCFGSHHIIKLVPEQRDCQHWNSMVHRLQEAVLSTVGDEETRFCVAWGKQRIETSKGWLMSECLDVVQSDSVSTLDVWGRRHEHIWAFTALAQSLIRCDYWAFTSNVWHMISLKLKSIKQTDVS